MTIEEIIDETIVVRINNNIPWRQLMLTAARAKPVETAAIIEEITANDLRVSELMSRLVKALRADETV